MRGPNWIVDPPEPAVLAYMRQNQSSAALVVNNLSSQPSTAELKLGTGRRSTPVDVLTGESLPAIGGGTYTLPLEGYQFRWLRLER